MATLGQGAEIEFEGETYRVAPIGPGVRSNFAKLFKTYAFRELDKLREVVDAARFSRLESALALQMTLSKYEWGEECHAEIMDRRAGVALEALARMRVNHPQLTYELVYRMAESLTWESFVVRVNSADGPVPNAEAPPNKEAVGPDLTMKS